VLDSCGICGTGETPQGVSDEEIEKRKRLVQPRQALEGWRGSRSLTSTDGPKRLEGLGAGAGQAPRHAREPLVPGAEINVSFNTANT
jgi:hypothetical protein